MDAHAAQLRHQIDETRATMDATLTQLEQRISQVPVVLLEQQVLGPMGGLQETVTRATTLLHRYPWLIIAAGALVGSQLRGAKGRIVRPVQPPPPKAAVMPPLEPPSVVHVRPTISEAPQRLSAAAAAPTDAGGARASGPVRLTRVRLDTRRVRRHRAGAAGDRRNPGR